MELFCLYDPTCAPLAFVESPSTDKSQYTCELPALDKIKQLMIFVQNLSPSEIQIDVSNQGSNLHLCTLSEQKNCQVLDNRIQSKIFKGHSKSKVLKKVLLASVVSKNVSITLDGKNQSQLKQKTQKKMEKKSSNCEMSLNNKKKVETIKQTSKSKTKGMDHCPKQDKILKELSINKFTNIESGKSNESTNKATKSSNQKLSKEKVQIEKTIDSPDIKKIKAVKPPKKILQEKKSAVKKNNIKIKKDNIDKSQKLQVKDIGKNTKDVKVKETKKQNEEVKNKSEKFSVVTSKVLKKKNDLVETKENRLKVKALGNLKDGIVRSKLKKKQNNKLKNQKNCTGSVDISSFFSLSSKKSSLSNKTPVFEVEEKNIMKGNSIQTENDQTLQDLSDLLDSPSKNKTIADECLTQDQASLENETPYTSISKKSGKTVISDIESIQQINEKTPAEQTLHSSLPSLTPKNGKKRKNIDNTPTPRSRKQKLAMRALDENMPSPAETKASIQNPIALTTVVSDNKKISRCVDLSNRVPKPSSRWGHSLTFVNSSSAVLIGGQGDKQLSRDSIWSLNPDTRSWKCLEVSTEGAKPEYRVGHSATYDETMRCIYVYGGSKNAKWFHDVHIFDLDENKWTLVKSNGKAPTRAYHTTTLFRHEMWVIGGVFPRPDPQPDGCDNSVHIFSPVMESWYQPIVTGDKPCPRSGHSATLLNDQLVLFGGWDFPVCFNDLHILDLTTVDWSAPKVLGTSPKARSWHASCSLSNNRVFIHGGYDGYDALHDAHVFDLTLRTWTELSIDTVPSARAGHQCFLVPSQYEELEEDEVMVFGGGDNDGTYFSDMFSFYIPFDTLV